MMVNRCSEIDETEIWGEVAKPLINEAKKDELKASTNSRVSSRLLLR